MGIESDRQRTVFLLENCMSPSVIALDLGVPYFQVNPTWNILESYGKGAYVLIISIYIYLWFLNSRPLAAKDAEVELVTWSQILLRWFNIIGLPKVGTWLASGFI